MGMIKEMLKDVYRFNRLCLGGDLQAWYKAGADKVINIGCS